MIEGLEIALWAGRTLGDLGLGIDPSSPETAATIGLLALMTGFALKHFLCDFVLQTGWQVRNKGRYGHPGGLVHSGLHALGTAPLLLGLPPLALVGLLVAEFALHYHIDWSKDRVTKWAGWTPATHMFWIAIGFDQLLHGLSYIALAAFIALAL